MADQWIGIPLYDARPLDFEFIRKSLFFPLQRLRHDLSSQKNCLMSQKISRNPLSILSPIPPISSRFLHSSWLPATFYQFLESHECSLTRSFDAPASKKSFFSLFWLSYLQFDSGVSEMSNVADMVKFFACPAWKIFYRPFLSFWHSKLVSSLLHHVPFGVG